MSDMTHSYERHDSFICVTWLIHMCDMTHSYQRHDSFICVTWFIHIRDMTHSSHMRYTFEMYTHLFLPQKSPYSDKRDPRRSDEWHRYMSLHRETWLIHMSDMTPSYERHDSFIWETWLILHTWDIRVKYTHISRTCEIYGECWIRCLKVQVCFLKRAINDVALLRKMTYICELIAHSAFAISPTRAQWGTHISASDKGPQGKRRITFFHMKESCRSYEWVKSLCVVAFVWATWLLHMKDRRTRNDVRREATNTIVRNNIARHKQQHCQKQATTLSETSGKRRMILLETTSLRGTLWVLRKCHVRMCACFFVWKYRALLSHDKSALCHVTKEPYIFTQKSPMTQRWITPFKITSFFSWGTCNGLIKYVWNRFCEKSPVFWQKEPHDQVIHDSVENNVTASDL